VAGALPAVAARRAGRCRTHRRAAGEPGEPLRLRPDRGQADDRGPPAGRDDRQGPDPGGHDRRAAGRRRGRPGPHRHRAGSDFFGAGVTQGSTLGERVFGNALAGRRADFIGNPDLPHTYSYVPDIAAGLATLGTDARAAGQVWHLPGPPTVTTRAAARSGRREAGHPVGIRSVPKLALRLLGLVNPMLRELPEMAYEFDQPFILDTSKYETAFGAAGTPLADAIAATIAWYRTRPGTP
jgi:hypothetical protein